MYAGMEDGAVAMVLVDGILWWGEEGVVYDGENRERVTYAQGFWIWRSIPGVLWVLLWVFVATSK